MAKLTFPKLHLACSHDDLRPVMNHILINKKHVVASNAHVLIQYDTDCLFSDKFIEAMPESFLIHRNIWQKLCKKHNLVIFKDNLIVIYYDGYSDCIVPIIKDDLKYPDYQKVFPLLEHKKDIGEIGLSAHVLDVLINVLFFGDVNKIMRFELYDKHRAIVVYPEDVEIKAKALIIPAMLRD